MYKNPAKTLFMGHSLVFMPECHSTNEEALKLCKSDHPAEGVVVITASQTAGRGQRGSTWESEKGRNLTFSLVLKPHFLDVKYAFDLSRALSLGIRDYLAAEIHNAPAFVKWPNDIIVGNEKICGILIENVLAGSKVSYAVCGVGLNVNQTIWPFPAISLARATGHSYDLSVVLEDLLSCVESRYLQLRAAQLDGLRADYLNHLFWRGETHRFKTGGAEMEGCIEGVDEQGRLQVLTSGVQRTFLTRELAYVR